jgi:hypothetical protein
VSKTAAKTYKNVRTGDVVTTADEQVLGHIADNPDVWHEVVEKASSEKPAKKAAAKKTAAKGKAATEGADDDAGSDDDEKSGSDDDETGK